MKADDFRDLVLTPGTAIDGGVLRGCTATIIVEGMPRWTRPTARLTFDDGSVATFPISETSELHTFPPGFFNGTGI